MAKRGIRLVIVALLLIGGAIAGQMLLDIDRRSDDLIAAEADITARLTRIATTLTGIGAAQQSYVAPGQADSPWFERMSGLLRQFYDDSAAAGPLLRAPEASAGLQSLAESSEALIAADTRARENLRLGQELMAADLVFTDAHASLEAMAATVSQLQADEQAVYRMDRAALASKRWTILGAVGGGWAILALLLAWGPGRKDAAAPLVDVTLAEPAPPVAAPDARGNVDLAAAADLCVALSRVTSTSSLPGLLTRAAGILDASGIIVWMSAGEELFAVTAHGYKPQMIARLGPIARTADNATAAAWREGRITVVPGDRDTSGAIVAPMFGPDSCIGVLSVELRQHRDADPALQSVASMIAAQLATAVSAWPAASPAPVVARQLAREFRSAGV